MTSAFRATAATLAAAPLIWVAGMAPVEAAPVTDTTAVSASTTTANKLKVKSKKTVLAKQAARLVTTEVPGDIESVATRKRLGLETWRIVVSVDSGYRIAAFVDKKSGIIIDWRVLAVPADVDYIPPAQPPKNATVEKDATGKPIPATLPEPIAEAVKPKIVEQPAPPPVAPQSSSSSDSDSDDDSASDSDESDSRDGHSDREDSRESDESGSDESGSDESDHNDSDGDKDSRDRDDD